MSGLAIKRRFGSLAIVTGASEGIGRAFAESLAEEGLDLILVARREPQLLELASSLAARHGVVAQVHAIDLARPDAVAELLRATEGRPVGLVVAAAGFGSLGRFLDLSVHSELAMVDLNCRAIVELAHGFGQRMAAQGGGGMVLFGSLVGFQGAPLSATYAATKGFVQNFAEALAIEMRPIGVAVLAIAPGPVASGFASRAGMKMGRTDSARAVARGALAALGRSSTARPGLLSKVLGWSLACLPRAARVRVMGLIMRGMLPSDAMHAAANRETHP